MGDFVVSVPGASFISASASCIFLAGPFKLHRWTYGSEAGGPARSVIATHARRS